MRLVIQRVQKASVSIDGPVTIITDSRLRE